MENSDLIGARRGALEPAVIISALAVYGALSAITESASSMRLLAAFGIVHIGSLIGAARARDPVRLRVELLAAVLFPTVVTAILDRHASASVEPIGACLVLGACVLHAALCLDQTLRRRTRLITTTTEPTRPVMPPVRRQRMRAVLLAATGAVSLLSLARAVSLRSDASFSSTWGDAIAGASILVSSVPIVLAAHLALSVIAPRFRRGPPKPGGLSRLVLWALIGATAAVLLSIR